MTVGDLFTDPGKPRQSLQGPLRRPRTRVIQSGGQRRDRTLKPILERARRELRALLLDFGVAVKYSEDQPRDDHGRWTDEGAPTGAPAGAPIMGTPVDVNGEQYYRQKDGTLTRWRSLSAAVTDFKAQHPETSLTWLGKHLKPIETMATLQQAGELENRFPQVGILALSASGPLDTHTAQAQTHTVDWPGNPNVGKSTIQLNADYYREDGKSLYGMNNGWHPAGTSNPAGIITHEFGHAVMGYAEFKAERDVEFAASWSAYVDSAHLSVDHISGYGRRGSYGDDPASREKSVTQEEFAERFAAAYTPGASSHNDPYAQQLREWLQSSGLDTSTAVEPHVETPREHFQAALAAMKYREDQARDDHGRFAEEGVEALAAAVAQQTGTEIGPDIEIADTEAATTALKQYRDLAGQFPGVKFRDIVVANLQNAHAQVTRFGTLQLDIRAWSPVGTPLLSREAPWRDVLDPEEIAPAYRALPWLPAGTTSPVGIMTHEFGHIVDRDLQQRAVAGDVAASSAHQAYRAAPPISVYGSGRYGRDEQQASIFAAAYTPTSAHYDEPWAQRYRETMAAAYPAAKIAKYKIAKAQAMGLGFGVLARRTFSATLTDALMGGFGDAGGQNADSQDQMGWFAEMTDDIMEYIANFITDLIGHEASGSISEAQLESRLNLVAAAANPAYEQGFARGVEDAGVISAVTWHAQGDETTCLLCYDRDGETWRSDEEYPFPGQGAFGELCEGGVNCRCWLDFTVIPTLDDLVNPDLVDAYAAAATPDLQKLTDEELRSLQRLLAKYSEDQPRDDHGRFADAGGSEALARPDDIPKPPPDEPFTEHWAERQEERRVAIDARVAQVVSRWAAVGWPTTFGMGGRVLVSPDVHPDRWRVTRLDNHGEPIGHVEAWSMEDAVRQASRLTDIFEPPDEAYPHESRKIAAFIAKYSDDQPRDDHGRWSSDGGTEAEPAALAGEVSPEGFSFHPYRGTSPRTGYMVAMTGHTVKLPATILQDTEALADTILRFRNDNHDVFKPGSNVYLGGWVDSGTLWLEPSQRVSSREEAVSLGRSRDQIAIWDNERQEEIQVGGSGGTGPAEGEEGNAAVSGKLGSVVGGAAARDGARDGAGTAAPAGQEEALKYDPDQPRDELGRWTDEGGGGGAAAFTRSTSPRWTADDTARLRESEQARLPDEYRSIGMPRLLQKATQETGIKFSHTLGTLDHQAVREAVHEVVELHNRFPGVGVARIDALSRADEIRYNAPSGVAGGTFPLPVIDSARIALPSSAWSDRNAADLLYGDDAWHPAGCTTPSGTISHEFGHAVMLQVERDAAKDPALRTDLMLHRLDWAREPAISGYGREGRVMAGAETEEFAERFSAAYCETSRAKGDYRAMGLAEFLQKWGYDQG